LVASILASLVILGFLIYLKRIRGHRIDENSVSLTSNRNPPQQRREAPRLTRQNGGLSRMSAGYRASLSNRNGRLDNNIEGVDLQAEINENTCEQRKKIGKKKLAKLQLKEDLRKQREVEERKREERSRHEEEIFQEKKKQEEAREEWIKQQEQEEEKRRLQKQKQEEDEYQQWKQTFLVEQKGMLLEEQQEKEKHIEEFIQYITERKTVILEDLAAEFNMKTMETMDFVEKLEKEGKISGVMDDRGKFILITRLELEKVANFIKKRGRVSIEDIAYESNRLIELNIKKE